MEETFYLICLCLTKVSVLCFYLRIFPHQRFRWAAHTTMAFVVAPTLILVLMQVFQCVPIRYVWEGWMDSAQEHRCVDMNTLAYTAASFSIAQDLVILVLPLPLLVNLNTATRSKVGIIIMFSMGVFVLVTSCVRLRYMVTFGQSSNPSWDFANPLIWSGLEVAVSIIVACLPSLRVLFISLMPGLFSSIVSGGGNSSREGNLKETSGLSSGAGARSCGGGGGGTKRSRQRRSLIFFASKDREGEGNESQTELGLHLHLGDKMRGEVQTEICGPQQDYEERDGGGIRIKTTTTTRVDVDD